MTAHDKDKTITDDEFDEYLSGNSDVSALYHAADESGFDDELMQPSFDIDNSILAAAKREVVTRPEMVKKSYSPFSNNYFIPLSTAASIIIVVAVVSFFPEQVVPPVEINPKAASPVMLEEQAVMSSTVKQDQEQVQESIVNNKVLAKRSVVKKEFKRKRQLKTKNKLIESLSRNSDNVENKMQSDEIESIADDSVFIGRLFNTVVKKKMTFDEKIWASLPEAEWRRRIKIIYLRSGKLAVKDIIIAYNKKFPKQKLSIKDIVLDKKN